MLGRDALCRSGKITKRHCGLLQATLQLTIMFKLMSCWDKYHKAYGNCIERDIQLLWKIWNIFFDYKEWNYGFYFWYRTPLFPFIGTQFLTYMSFTNRNECMEKELYHHMLFSCSEISNTFFINKMLVFNFDSNYIRF